MHGYGRNIPLYYAFVALKDFMLWIPIWVVYLVNERGFSMTEITVADSIFFIGILVLEVPTGAIADHWGRSRSIALGALSLAVAVLIFAFADSFPILLVSFLTWSVASTLMSGADMALLYDTLKILGREAEYERIAGRGHAASWIGAGAATLVGAAVAGWWGSVSTIYIGAATLVAASTLAFAMKEPPHQAPEGQRTGYWRGIALAFRDAWATSEVRAAVLLGAGIWGGIGCIQYLVQPYLLDRGVEVGPVFGLLQVPTMAAGAVGALMAATFARRGAAAVIPIAGLAGIGSYLALAVAPALWGIGALYAVFFLEAIMAVVLSGYINRRITSERRATILSIVGMGHSVVMASFAPVMGWTTDSHGLTWAFTAGGLFIAAILLFLLPGYLRSAARAASLPEPAPAGG